jgi:hypothetical protein
MTAIELIHTRELAGAAITEAGGLGAPMWGSSSWILTSSKHAHGAALLVVLILFLRSPHL